MIKIIMLLDIPSVKKITKIIIGMDRYLKKHK